MIVRITRLLLFVALIFVVLSAFVAPIPVLAQASRADEVHLMVVELVLREGGKSAQVYEIPPTDNSMTNPDYGLLPFHWYTTAKYWINPGNYYGLSTRDVVANITASANTWDNQTSAAVFSYQGTTTRSAGRYDRYNVVAWGRYRAGVIAVTYIWYSSSHILETDTMLNTYYAWSLTGKAGKMDVQNIMTHEFGHWAGLDDLYSNADYWLTMYGYANYGETYKRTLGLGDILGLQAVYGK